MAKLKNIYVCEACGFESAKWMGKCPACEEWNSFSKELIAKTSSTLPLQTNPAQKAVTLQEIDSDTGNRVATDIEELNRVLSGGIVEGSLTLVGGDPGIGKSTLILQMCESLGRQGLKVLYVSGEESVQQIKLRAQRLAVSTANLLLLSETNMQAIEHMAVAEKPKLLIIDSIQTMYHEDLPQTPGSITQVRECTSKLMRLGKGNNISILIVGHVTKEGAIAGPRVLEHMVDTVLYFEGEKKASYRILRAVKNRFGSTNEIGVFAMGDRGLIEIPNPSEFMLSGRPLNVAGSVVTASMEGTRPVLTEVQALASPCNFGVPRRMATGMDYNRAALLLAVLEKRLHFQMGNFDIYINLAGGMKIAEPALDAAVISAVASSYKNKPVDPYTAVFGEVGLAGEVRGIGMIEKRIAESSKMGFETCIIPKENLKSVPKDLNTKVYGVSNINELLDILLF